MHLSPEERLDELKEYYPEAKIEDWELVEAGYRVQVNKKNEEEGGVLEFGTEVVRAKDGSIAALLGASPGASTAVSIMLDLIKHCFPGEMLQAERQRKLRQIIPSYEKYLNVDEQLLNNIRTFTSSVLELNLETVLQPQVVLSNIGIIILFYFVE